MITTLDSMIGAELGWTWRDHVGTAPIVDSNRHLFSKRLTDGAAAGQANAIWHLEDQTLPCDQSLLLQLDLLEQSLFGDTITIRLASVKALLIVNENTASPGYLRVGGAPPAPWFAPFGAAAHTIKVMPGCPLLLANVGSGWPIEADAHLLQLQAADGPVDFQIAILGTLAVPHSA